LKKIIIQILLLCFSGTLLYSQSQPQTITLKLAEDEAAWAGVIWDGHCRLVPQFEMRFPLNEYSSCLKMGYQPLAHRLYFKVHNWEDICNLIPQMAVEERCRCAFSCPDIIGGGLGTSFLDESKIDRELVVRSAQGHALMTINQLSVSPWRIIDQENQEVAKKALKIGMEHTTLPIRFTRDQFILRNNLLVAPMLEKGTKTRSVLLSKETWVSDVGKKDKGGKTVVVESAIDRLSYYEKIT